MGDANPDTVRLSASQRNALRQVSKQAEARCEAAYLQLIQIAQGLGGTQEIVVRALANVRQHARVVLHFHPDRIGSNSQTAAEALLHEGLYRNQFETGLSSGSRTAYPGGARDEWERTLFGGAYHTPNSMPDERPKYGALELVRYSDGPWPRFGSCYFVLRPSIRERTTLTWGGSEQANAAVHLGMCDSVECVLAPLFVEVAGGRDVSVPWPPFHVPILGLESLTLPGLLKSLCDDLALPRPDPLQAPLGRVLDSGVEAQIHGPLRLEEDVELLVADPSFEGTRTGNSLEELCDRFAIELAWHRGFRLSAADVPEDFRGPAVARLATRVAQDGVIDAAAIGVAEASLHTEPESWASWGTRAEIQQQLKQLWHVLVHSGQSVK